VGKVNLSGDIEKAERERLFIEDICKRVQKSDTVLYVLREEERTLGFIALSVSSIDNFPSLQVDYLFVSRNFRGMRLKYLDNLKISNYLIEFAIDLAQDIQERVGLRYLVLLPDNNKLHDIYQNMGFETLSNQRGWMYIKLK
jgi:hypothetical protein